MTSLADPEVLKRYRSMIYQMQAEGRFPQRIKLGEQAVGWLESEVRLAARIETSRSRQHDAN